MRQTGGVTCLVRHGPRPVVTDEPDALIGHVRVCGGSGGQPLLLPGTAMRHATRQRRVEPEEKIILCYNDAIKTLHGTTNTPHPREAYGEIQGVRLFPRQEGVMGSNL